MTEPLAIVDVETTGTSALYGRIIEIGIVRLDPGEAPRTYETLLNPECTIHPRIEQLTGISNRDVVGAPVFAEVAREVYDLLDGAVFVAHNARFDYSFVKGEFARLGRGFTARCLCTVKLSRSLFPQHRHHDLSSVIARHGIQCASRHRALGDALAVQAFLEQLQATEPAERLEKAFRTVLKDNRLPPQMDRAELSALPDEPGVYLFYGPQGELLYVGKSKSIRSRVLGHFSADGSSGKEMEMCRNIHRVEVRRTVGELGALLLESALIKELRPIYNTASRRTRLLTLARGVLTREGYLSIVLDEVERVSTGDTTSILGVFKYKKQAGLFLHKIAREHRLCHRLLGLERTRGACFAHHLHQCDGACIGGEATGPYNRRVELAFGNRRVKAWPFPGPVLIEERDPLLNEGEVYVVDNWCLLATAHYSDVGTHQDSSATQRFDHDTYKILYRYLMNAVNRRNIRLMPASYRRTGGTVEAIFDEQQRTTGVHA
jgi:DNA polymerase-3 subunit epsilon